jgi:hypothetical protein
MHSNLKLFVSARMYSTGVEKQASICIWLNTRNKVEPGSIKGTVARDVFYQPIVPKC